MNLKITLLPGDGIGPEVIAEAVKVLNRVAELRGHKIVFDEQLIGGVAIRATGRPLPEKTVAAALASDAVLMGSVGSPEFDAMPREKKPETGLLAIRKALGGFANLRPVKAYPALTDASPLKNERMRGVDILTVRELLGGLYFGEPRGFTGQPGDKDESAYNTMRYSRPEVERVARIAFDLARGRGKKLTSVDKANVLESSQLWRRVVTEIAREYPDVALDHCYVDSFAMRLVTSPSKIDVVLTENLFGDILTDESAVLTGSLGLLASATLGGEVALYEPIHGSAPDIAGKGIANPIGTIASAAMLLRHSALLNEEAQAVEDAIAAVIEEGARTADLAYGSPSLSTREMGDRIAAKLAEFLR
jgi:3-isopropylmalate dehydrogenase